MKKQLTNAFYGVLDYASYPVGMLAVAPIVLHKLGAAEYGLWMISTSVVSGGGIIASGFGDAALQRIGSLRGTDKRERIVHTACSLFAISLVLGCVLAAGVWIAAPYAATRIAQAAGVLQIECVGCIRIASFLIVLRAIEVVAVITQRAFEEYRETVQISVGVRLVTLAFAAVAPFLSMQTKGIMAVSAVFFAVGVVMQFRLLRDLLGNRKLWSNLQSQETRTLFASGIFVWLQTAGSVIFRQLDRILLGISLGALMVAPYAVCIQLAEPLFGLTASALSFFFPYLSERAERVPQSALRRSIFRVFACNLFLVLAGLALLFAFGQHFLYLFAGPSVASRTTSIFSLILTGSALSGISVTGTYAMQALGQFRTIAYISLATRGVLLLVMLLLLQHLGMQGLAVSRLCYGAASLLVYVPLARQLGIFGKEPAACATAAMGSHLQEGV